jgi:hypothetical protein
MPHIERVKNATPSRRLAAALSRTATLALTVALIAAAAACTNGDFIVDNSAGPTSEAGPARTQLDALTVAPAGLMAGYSRDRFPHWSAQGNGCDTREVVLKRDGTEVKSAVDCHPTSGKWLSVYENKQVTDPDLLDIDHMVPLAAAWRTGADKWTDSQRQQFANDLTRPQLIAVSASTNRAKGDQDPSQWKPPNHAFWCEYAKRWVAVKHFWKLSVTDSEKTALADMLGTCLWQSSAPQTSPPAPVG